MRYLALVLLLLGLAACTPRPAGPEVIVYCALDQIYSEPILMHFQRTTGITVRAKYDLEATKTSGLVNQLMAEKGRPQCDVFWNNEILQTVVLARLGMLEPYRSPSAEGIPPAFRDPDDRWTGFAARVRVIIYHPERLGDRSPPASVQDLVDPRWKGEAAMALPLFGTTLTHFAALSQVLGPEETDRLLSQVQANEVALVDGNSVVKDRVAAGLLTWGLTDSDDANSAILDGRPVEMLIPDQQEGQMGTLVIPNTVAIIEGAPHPEEARKLVDYLLSVEVEERLARGRSLQIPLHHEAQAPAAVPRVEKIKAMQVDFEGLAEDFASVLNRLREQVLH